MKADEFFAIRRAYIVAENEMNDAILVAIGVDPEDPDAWPCKDFTFDEYDGSFELLDCTPGWAPTPAQLEACWWLGFERCWFCYTDETERAAARGHPLSDSRPSRPRR